jgi:hypothetical protein
MKPKTEVKSAPLPGICSICVERLFKSVEGASDKQTQFLHFCPHHSTVIHTEHADIDNQRYITKWICETPCSENRYLEMATALAAINRVGGGGATLEGNRTRPVHPRSYERRQRQTIIFISPGDQP